EPAHEAGLTTPRAQPDLATPGEPFARRLVGLLDRAHRIEHLAPGLAEDRLEQLVLRAEVVVQQAVRDPGLLGDVSDARLVIPLPREDTHGRVEDETPLVLLTC